MCRYTYVYIHIYTYMFICTCIYIYAYMCEYIYFQEKRHWDNITYLYIIKIIYYFFTRVRSGICF